MFKTLAINLGDMQSLVCASVVRRLRRKKWSPDAIREITEKAISIIEKRIEDSLESIAEDAATMAGNGADKDNVQTMVKAAFAVIGVEVADDLHASKNAEWN